MSLWWIWQVFLFSWSVKPFKWLLLQQLMHSSLLHCTAELLPWLLWDAGLTAVSCFLTSHLIILDFVSIGDKDSPWPTRIAFCVHLVQCTLLNIWGWSSVTHTCVWNLISFRVIVAFNIFWKPLLLVIKKMLVYWISSQMEHFWTWRHF